MTRPKSHQKELFIYTGFFTDRKTNMIQAHQLTVGMTIVLDEEYYRVESLSKVAVQKTMQLIRVKLRHVQTGKAIERNFKPAQKIDEASVEEHKLEYLYPHEEHFVFLDINTLDLVHVEKSIIGDAVLFLKEGTEVKATCVGSHVFTVELPQFLELMIASIAGTMKQTSGEGPMRKAKLESGAEIEVPPFVEVGDIVKVDTKSKEYIQRV